MMKYLLFLLFLLLKAGTATAQNNLVVNGIPCALTIFPLSSNHGIPLTTKLF